MRRTLLAAVAAFALFSGRAHAMITVIDPTEIGQTINLLKQQIQSYATQLQQLQQAAMQVEWTVNTFNSLVEHPNLGAVLGMMNQLGVNDPLPVDPYALQGLINGSGGINGALGMLSTLSNSSWNANHVYTPTDGSWQSQQMIANANGIAGAQGIAQQVYQQMGQHFAVISGLRQDLLAATTPAQREHVMGQIQAEQAWTQNAQGQLQAANIMLVSQHYSQVQQENENMERAIDRTLADAKASGMVQ
jgi:conjugal transfer/entry exclusion protein